MARPEDVQDVLCLASCVSRDLYESATLPYAIRERRTYVQLRIGVIRYNFKFVYRVY